MFRFGLALIAVDQVVKNATQLHPRDLQSSQANLAASSNSLTDTQNSIASFTVVLAVAWKEIQPR